MIKSLQQKKYREESQRFVVEGVKLCGEALAIPNLVEKVVYTPDPKDFPYPLPHHALTAKQAELERLSSLHTPNRILAVCRKPDGTDLHFDVPFFVLDAVSDPGNLGTLLRISDWFGFRQMVLLPGCADPFNPKVVQASMGSIFRVHVLHCTFAELLAHLPKGYPLIGTEMDAPAYYEFTWPAAAALVLGSEAHGMGAQVRAALSACVSIPRYGAGESLNVAVAAGIMAAHWKRLHP